jgi:Tfp pilus assembly protein PilX
MKFRRTCAVRHERGAVLVVSLIMLAVLTLFVISMIKTSIIELKIGGASQTAAINRAAAESAIENFLSLNSGRFAPSWLTAIGPAGPVAGSLNYTTALSAYGAAGSAVILVANQIGCGATRRIGESIGQQSLQAVQFDVAATATGGLGTGGAAVIHQGVQALAPSGACP